jgi:hypothetical protein
VPEFGAGRAAQLATGALRGAISGGMAGGAFGLGNAISEDALGDPDALGEHLLQNVGIGALWGGVPGGILGALHEAIPGVAHEAADATVATQDALSQAGAAPAQPGLIGKGLAAVSSMVSGAPQSEIEYAIANKARALITPEQFLAQAEDLTANLQKQYDSIGQTLRTANSDLRPAETEKALADVPVGPARDLLNQQVRAIQSAIAKMRAEPSLYSQYYPAYLEKALSDLGEKFSATAGISPEEAGFRQEVQEALPNLRRPTLGRDESGRFKSITTPETLGGVSPEAIEIPSQQPSLFGTAEAGFQGKYSTADIFNTLNDLKTKIDDNLIHYGANVPPEQQAAESIAKELRLNLKNSLQNQDVFGEAGARQAEFNDAQNGYLKQIGKKGLFRKFFTSQITTKSGKLIDRIDPGKVQTYLRNLGTLTGDDKAQALQSFMDASQNLLGQVQKTYESLPNSAVDLETARNSLTNNVNKISETTEQGKFNKIMGRLGGGAHNAQLGELAAGYTAVHNPALGAAIEGWNMARAPALAIRRYAQISKASASVASAIKKGAASVFGGAGSAIESSGSILPAISGLVGSQNPQWSEAKNKVEGVRNIASNMDALSERLAASTQHLANQAPKTSVGLMSAASRATAYLNSVLPPASTQFLMDNPKDVSIEHKNKLDRALQVVDQPQSAFNWIKDGTLTSDDLKGLVQVHPHTYNSMRTELLSHLSDPDLSKVPYQTKIGLSKFIDQPVDGSMSQSLIASNQLGLATSRKQSSTPGMTGRKTQVAGFKNMKRSERAATQTQEDNET